MGKTDELMKELRDSGENLDGEGRGSLERVVANLQDTNFSQAKELNQLRNRLSKKRKSPINIAIIPDSHATPEHNNDRFDWCGKWLADYKCDLICEIGDLEDCVSLCSYERKTLASEGRRIRDDIDVARDARERMANQMAKVNDWKPKLIACTGNHIDRVRRAHQEDPRLADLFDIDDFGAREYGWEVIPFLEPYVDGSGFVFNHFAPNPSTGKPIGGVYTAASVIAKTASSYIFGHSHKRSYHEQLRGDHRMMLAADVGCYSDQYMGYAQPAGNARWWRGLVMIREAHDGYGHIEWFPIDEIKKRYS